MRIMTTYVNENPFKICNNNLDFLVILEEKRGRGRRTIVGRGAMQPAPTS